MAVLMRLLALVGLALALGACSQMQRPLTPEEFDGFCWPSQVDFNCPDDNLCADFKAYLQQDHASLPECLKGCQMLQRQKWYDFPGGPCATPIENATDWCEMYCRRAFAAQQPAQP